MATNWSGFWGGSGYAQAYARNGVAMKMRQLMRSKRGLADKDQVVDLIAASTSTIGSVTRKRITYTTGGVLGGVVPTANETLVTTAANLTTCDIKVAVTKKTFPATYPRDLSGNGVKLAFTAGA